MLVHSIQGNFKEAKLLIEGVEQKNQNAIEFRLDLMEYQDLGPISILRNLCKCPVIFTLRPRHQGGYFSENEEKRKQTIQEYLILKPDFLDLEYDCPFIEKLDLSVPRIISYHHFSETPEDLQGILQQMQRYSAQLYKIATFARSSLDSLRMLKFVQETHVAGMCMGKLGEITRILGPVIGSPLTYTFCKGGREIAPGQLNVSDLKAIYNYSALDKDTKIFALIGDPIDYSLGHRVHNALFRLEKENAVYVKINLKQEELPCFFSLISSLPFYGFSVTMPLKESVIPYLDIIDSEAKDINAVNTIVRKENKWMGLNTDAKGALDSIEMRKNVSGKVVLILGAGGSAKAVAYEAAKRGAHIVIANRTLVRAKRLSQKVQGTAISLKQVAQWDYDFLVNTTPIGMMPQIDLTPISLEAIKENIIAFDIIIKPKETKFLSLAKKRGACIIYGYEMYARQAMYQLKIWLGRSFNHYLEFIESFAIS